MADLFNTENSSGNGGLFQTDGGQPGLARNSLEALITKYLKDEALPTEPPTAPAPTVFSARKLTPMPPSAEVLSVSLRGQQMNQLDGDVAAGISQYLPTPAIRLRMMKQHLSEEITRLREQLSRYENMTLQGEIAKKRTALAVRLEVLEQQAQHISQELDSLYTAGPWFGRIAAFYATSRETLSHWIGWLKKTATLSPEKQEALQLQAELLTLQKTLQEQLSQPSLSPAEISQALGRYERTLRRMETLTAPLRTPVSPLQQLWQVVSKPFK